MNIKKFLIANGNSTALIFGCPVTDRKKIVNKLLKEVEQVGFVSKKATLPVLEMMGGELCINATLAFASTLGKSGELTTSGLKNPIPYSNLKNKTTIKIPVEYEKKDNIILLDGIGYILFDTKDRPIATKEELSDLCKKYHLPAFGGIIFEGNRITPYVFVESVDSFVKETACGSGSIAFSILSGCQNVIQPSGKTISVEKKEFFEISAEVVEID